MVLDKKKVRTIVEPFEKEVYETFLKLDKQIEFMEVEIYYHKWHRFEGEATVITDFEIYVRNGGKESLILIECKHHSDAQSNIMKDLEGFAFKLNKVKQEYSGTETAVKPLFLIEVDSGEDFPGAVVNEALNNGIPC